MELSSIKLLMPSSHSDYTEAIQAVEGQVARTNELLEMILDQLRAKEL